MPAFFPVYPNAKRPEFVDYAEGMYIITKSGQRFLDTTAGSTSYAVLGYSHPDVLSAMERQMKRFCHLDMKAWSDENAHELANLLVSRASHGLDAVYFCGNSGGEACEAAMKMSYQAHFDQGKRNKHWFISRDQSYHGSSSDALSIGERPNLEFYRPMLPAKRARVSQHHPGKMLLPGESLDDYATRCAKELEDKILEIGPDNVCAFVGETMMGGLIGDVPPVVGYWRKIREVCTRYDVHLILDEVYCGLGSSGKVYCCDWDQVRPDFIFVGKTLAAGYAPLSAVVTSNDFLNVIRAGQGRLQHSTTHQCYSLGVAAALAVQKIVQSDEMLSHIQKIGNFMMDSLRAELSENEFFVDVRGRGMRFTFEYDCAEKNQFGSRLAMILEEKYKIIVSGKWHRVSFTPAFIMSRDQADFVLDAYVSEFKKLQSSWKGGAF